MAAGRRDDVERARTRRRALGAGLAGVAAALAVAPVAHASTPSAPPTPASNAGGAKAQAPKAAETTTVTPDDSTSTVTPDYGYQKIRVGVQEKDGTYPADQDTSGSEITIVETGPNVFNGTQTRTCLTNAGTRESGSTATYCVFYEDEVRRAGTFRPADPPDPITDPEDFYPARPGDSVTITQTSLGPNDNKVLLIDGSVKKYGPCTLQDSRLGGYGVCDDTPPALFTDPGIPPVAVNDSATTPENTPVTINVLSNDDTVVGAPVTGLKVIKDPSNGTVSKTAAPAAVTTDAVAPTGPKFVYTPKNGFSGVDHFSYQLTDANGTATAVVTITVPAAPSSSSAPTPTPTPTTTPSTTPSLSISATASSSAPPLADTGSPDVPLGEIGALLVAIGGAATVVGRRRRRPGRHAN